MRPELSPYLNRSCHCIPVDTTAIDSIRDSLSPGGAQSLHPGLFAREPVFVSAADVEAISQAVAAFETMLDEPTYVTPTLARAPAIAQLAWGPKGALTSFDFHLDAEGPRLIEVNTNGGGALLNAALRAEHSLDTAMMDMFVAEWSAQRGSAALRHIAIVDTDPQAQPMFAEFELFGRLFERHGIDVSIVDPSELRFADRALWRGSTRIDLLYNRLTDFYFADPAHAEIAQAYERGAVVVTPNPHAHALYANKHNLSRLGAHPAAPAALQRVLLPSRRVTEASAEQLWADRKRYYFKPAGGHGSRGVYRGAKLTRRVWAAIIADGNYLAQREVPPSRRVVVVDGDSHALKFDVRAYAYAGQVQQLSARVYRGQTTNLRTKGGGFAQVIVTP
ncbi:MAG: hypothetical protein K0V04_17295 [Deltaproteobacteria bacterium]|nr:hypothetical protein [Deltaproteobacteria bacterium]